MSGIGSQSYDFTATGTIETFVVPQTGTYYIAADGAPGGSTASAAIYGSIDPGGQGGMVGADFTLLQGETLDIAVGEAGGTPQRTLPNADTGGGGGGSFVVLVEDGTQTVLEVAGGGGGASGGGGGSQPTAGGSGGAAVGGSGLGGTADASAGGGAGFFGNGANPSSAAFSEGGETVAPGTGGADFANGLAGGVGAQFTVFTLPAPSQNGGFGGGGGAGQGGLYYEGGGGGGGGYTGGNAGSGGTSYIASFATNTVLDAGVATAGDVVVDYLSCFVEGTRLATATGARTVETLRPGDMVLSARRAVPVEVRLIGHRHIDSTRHPDPAQVLPVCIRAHAFGRGLPARGLFLSPDHAVFAEGVLIPVRALVNGCSIAQQTVARVTYWHVEVDQHDVLLAEGLPVESYLDTGQRAAFIGGLVTALATDFTIRVWEAQGCASLRVTGPEVDTVRARLEAQRAAQRAAQAA